MIVSFKANISPLTSTVIFWARSPLATAVVTWAILRTWLVKFAAIALTLSVRSFHVPPTPGTAACPPNFPSVPTSLATRVTSAAKVFKESTILLMVSFNCNTSPAASIVIFWARSPLATAVVTKAIFLTWLVKLAAIALTRSVRSFQVPATPGTAAWPPNFPSVPTSLATRVTSAPKRVRLSTILLMVLFNSRISPFASTVIFCARSPLATAVVTWAMLRTCEVRLAAIALTLSVKSFQRPATLSTLA